MIRPLALIGITVLLVGCAAAPPVPLAAHDPASPTAPAGATLSPTTSLRADATTRKSAALLSVAKKEQDSWDAYGPVSGTPEDAPKPEMKHDHH